MHWRKTVTVGSKVTATLATAALLVGSALVATPASAAEPVGAAAQRYESPVLTGDEAPFPPGESDLWTATSGSETYVPGGPLVPPPPPEDGGISPQLLDPATWTFCYVANDIDYPIKEYFAAYYSGFQGTINLTCGSAGFGYKHIEAGHASQWGHFASLADGTWDDFMSFAVGTTLAAPAVIANNGIDKLCYVAPIFFSNGSSSFTIYSKVIISMNNRWVITAYPSSSPLAC